MSINLPGEQGRLIVSFLDHQRTAIFCTTASSGVWAIPVWYRLRPQSPRSRDLKLDCLLPRWADAAHHLTQDSKVVLIVQATSGAGLRWLQIRGFARQVDDPDWTGLMPRWGTAIQPDALYIMVRVTPKRIDLVDEDQSWGVQQTMEW